MTTCTTCRWYRYLQTLNVHICNGPGAGEITEEDTHKDCDAWEVRQ